jgi:hypothetical protein
MQSSSHRWGPLLRDLFLTAGAIIASIVVLEISLRLCGVVVTGSLYTTHPTREFAFRPGAQAWYTEEGRSFIRINHDGYRDSEHPTAKAAGTVRIAMIGSSTVAESEVDFADTATQVLERVLSTRLRAAGRTAEVMNFGVPDYSLAHQYLVLRDDVRRYRPDIVVVGLSLRNDLFNATRATKVTHADYPFFVLRDGHPVPDDMTLRKFNLASGWHRPVLADHLKDLMNGWCRLCLIATYAYSLASRALEQDWHKSPDDRLVFSPPANDDMKMDWQVTDATIEMMRKEAESAGAEFWIVTFDGGLQASPDLGERALWQRQMRSDNPFYPDEHFGQIAERHGIPHVILGPLLAAYTQRTGVSIHGFPNSLPNQGHLNEAGLRIAGQLIADGLCSGSRLLAMYCARPAGETAASR